MNRYIDADKLRDEIEEWLEHVGTAWIEKGTSYYYELLGCIDDTPTADVVEVKHKKRKRRKWIVSDITTPSGLTWVECDCGSGMWCPTSPYAYPNYCPYCGAKMDGEKK